MIPDEKPDRDRIAIPDTRPNMWMFVPAELGVMMFVGALAFANQTHSPLNVAIIIPAWVLAAILCRNDPNGVRVAMVQVRLILIAIDAARWGGMSVTPWRTRHA